MTTKPTFKTYADHESALCFKCERPLAKLSADTPRDSGFPTGKWVNHCPHCHMKTWYDVAEKA